ncbi:MAG: histidine kinase [Bacteroidetes bacterium]|nr:histidine kinase [Bacteroidota bacterium]
MKTFTLPTKAQLIFAAIAWFVISNAFQVMLVYQVSHTFSGIDTCITACLLAIAVFFVYILQRYSANYFNNLFTRIGLLGVLIFKVVFLQKFLISRLVYAPGYEKIVADTMIIRMFTAFLVMSFYSFVLWLVFYIKRTDEQNSLKLSAESSLRDAELMKLRQQIQPHFLFNSLNSINALIGSEPLLARKMIQTLSDFLRGTLKKDENNPVPLEEEIELLKLYLDIEKVRFGHRMTVDFNVEALALEKKVPPMLLQPVVENAIKFGLYNVLEEVKINISASVQHNALNIRVTNPFDEKTAVTRQGEGFGLSLIQRRLQLIYHRTDLLKIQKQDGVFTTIIIIPQA